MSARGLAHLEHIYPVDVRTQVSVDDSTHIHTQTRGNYSRASCARAHMCDNSWRRSQVSAVGSAEWVGKWRKIATQYVTF